MKRACSPPSPWWSRWAGACSGRWRSPSPAPRATTPSATPRRSMPTCGSSPARRCCRWAPPAERRASAQVDENCPMDLALTEDQLALREAVTDLLTKESPPERVRAAEPSGFDPELWALVAGMGLPSMTVPEAAGGGGGSMADLAVVAEEFGRRVPAAPLIEAAAATDALARAGAGPLLQE